MSAAVSEATQAARTRRQSLHVVLPALRPRQWTKNLLLFAGLLFAAKLGDDVRWLEAGAAFAAFCAASGASYLANDVRDAARDRLHPTKRRRPVAAGTLSPARALNVAALLTVAALALGATLGARFELLLSAFLILQAVYTLKLKKLPVVDVAAIGGCFVLRAAAGAAAVRVHISPWLLLCTALLALVLGFAKRRAELVHATVADPPPRAVLRRYSRKLLDPLITSVAIATMVAYIAYTLAAPEQRELAPTVAFVAFGLARYLWLVHHDDLGEEPERILLADGGVRGAVLLWAVTAGLILTVA